MKSLTINILLVIVLGVMFFVKTASAEMSPRDGYIKTPTGAPLAGITIAEYSDWCPPNEQISQMMGSQCINPSNCHSERSVKTDANGYYFFPPGIQPINSSDPCNMNVWWRYTCSNPQVFYKIILDSPQSANAIITPAHAAGENICPPPVQHPTDNTSAVITTPISCPPPPACNTVCQSQEQCKLAGDGCTVCVEGLCKTPPACNTACERDGQCEGAKNGCTSCLPNDTGTGKACRPPAACNVACTRDDQCAGARDGCTSCLPSDTGSGNVCRKTPACNVACTKDGQCAGAKDGCTACVGGVCRIPPACGVACTTKAECAGAKDGCSDCLEGTCTNYKDNMCKCDGMVAELDYPNDFNFEAFGKVEGEDIKKAEIADVTFRLTRDNQVVAKSNPITPTIVENTAQKVRFKASWTTPPPQVSRNSVYRVFADVRCKPKRIVASADESFTPNPEVVVKASQFKPPLALKLVTDLVDKLLNSKAWIGRRIVGDVMAQLSSPSPSPSSAQSNLQLQTLNFVKLMDTDNCRFVMFKFDETLF